MLPVLMALISIPFLPTLVSCEVVDRCVAVVNNDVITLSEVNEVGKPLFQRVAEQVPPDKLADALKQARQTVIEKLIDKKLLLQEAKKRHLSVSDKEVDEALHRILEQNHTTMAQFKKELARVGMTEKRYREDLHDQILSTRLVNHEVRSKVIIPEEQIIDYYDLHYTEHMGKGGYYVLQIGVSWKEDTPAARLKARKKIEHLRKLALEGRDFRQLARQYSDLPSAADGGDLGVFKAKEMAPAMRRVIVHMKPGQISPIVENNSSLQIFKLLSRQEGDIITKEPFGAVKDTIREKLYQEEMKKRYRQWMKEIREQSYIKIL